MVAAGFVEWVVVVVDTILFYSIAWIAVSCLKIYWMYTDSWAKRGMSHYHLSYHLLLGQIYIIPHLLYCILLLPSAFELYSPSFNHFTLPASLGCFYPLLIQKSPHPSHLL